MVSAVSGSIVPIDFCGLPSTFDTADCFLRAAACRAAQSNDLPETAWPDGGSAA